MKISITDILIDHLQTLNNGKSVSKTDLAVFYAAPIALSLMSYIDGVRLTKDFHSLSITLFGIFTPLLLNIQVAVFSIFQRKWPAHIDTRIERIAVDEQELRRKLLAEINSNISYLTLISCGIIILSAIFFATGFSSRVFSSAVVFVYSHFFLTLLMVVKRSHVLFRKEYEV